MDINDNIQEHPPKTSRSIFSHMLEIINAAFPYLDSDTQQSADLIVKTGELMEAYQFLQKRDSVKAFSISKQEIDIEALLTNVRTVCYDQEKELIDKILNLFKMKDLYETYSVLAQSMASQSGNSENSDGEGGLNPDMMEILEAFLTPEQKDTFDNINTMFNAMH